MPSTPKPPSSKPLAAKQPGAQPPSPETRSRSEEFPSQYNADFFDQIERTILGLKPEARIAAFDADGTLWSTDLGENFFNYQIKQQLVPLPPDPWQKYLDLKKINNDPRPAYLWLAQINAGVPLEQVRTWAEEAVRSYSNLPIFNEQKRLIELLQRHHVEIFIVTASITWAVEPGARRLGIKDQNVIGVETAIAQEKVTDLARLPVTYKEGKVEALLQRTNGQLPFLSCGNTSGDIRLLEAATHHSIAINSVGPGDRIYSSELELKELALKNSWPYFFL